MSKLKPTSKILNLKNFAFCIIIFTFSFLIFNLATKAVFGQALSLGIWPPLLEVMIQPGKSITQVYKLTNGGETDLALTSRLMPFKPEGEQGNISLGTPGVNIGRHTGNERWFSFQNADLALGEKFILPAGKTQEIVLKIKIPQNAPEDDYYATLLFETLPGVFLPAGQTGGEIQAKIGANILLTVSTTGQPQKKAEIAAFQTARIIDSFTKPQFLVRLKNTGRAFFKPFGTIATTGWFGQKWVLDLLPENILVDSVRQINCQKSDSPTPCQLPAKFLLGKYTARLEFGLDETSGEYQKEFVFWAIPIKLTLGILTAIVLLIFVASKMKKLPKVRGT